MSLLSPIFKLIYPVPAQYINVGAYYREAWIKRKAKKLKKGTKVLDAGAGESPYREYFSHCDYKTQDFGKYEGMDFGPQAESWNYDDIDYVSDITEIPVDDSSFDVVLCTEVLEHVPFPIDTLMELVRVLRPGGKIWITAPLASGLHQEPYHYYGGYTRHFYETLLKNLGMEVTEIIPTGGMLKHVGQEVLRAGRTIRDSNKQRLGWVKEWIMMHWLPNYLGRLDQIIKVNEFTIGYMVEAIKPNIGKKKL